MAEGVDGEGGGHRFPQALLAALRAEAPEGSLLQLGLWHGESLTLKRVVRETEDGILAELEPPPAGGSADRGPSLAAIPWHAIARVQAVPPPARRARPGFVAAGT